MSHLLSSLHLIVNSFTKYNTSMLIFRDLSAIKEVHVINCGGANSNIVLLVPQVSAKRIHNPWLSLFTYFHCPSQIRLIFQITGYFFHQRNILNSRQTLTGFMKRNNHFCHNLAYFLEFPDNFSLFHLVELKIYRFYFQVTNDKLSPRQVF